MCAQAFGLPTNSAEEAIFLLDQTGFSQVALELIARIFRELPAAEVILTFAADALVNHLAERPELITAVSPLELTESQIHELVEQKNGNGGKALVQRTLRGHIRDINGCDIRYALFRAAQTITPCLVVPPPLETSDGARCDDSVPLGYL